MDAIAKNKLYLIAYSFVVFSLYFFIFHDISNHTFLRWDDIDYVLENKHIQDLNSVNLLWMFTEQWMSNWHPITWLSYTINFTLWGDGPLSFKLTNIVIHLLNSALVGILTCYLIYILQNERKTSIEFSSILSKPYITYSGLIAGILFLLNPQHIESITWISGRKDLLCAFFYISATISYLRSSVDVHSNKVSYLVTLLFALSLMAKAMAITLPIILVLLDIFVLKRFVNCTSKFQTIQLMVSNKIPLFLIALAVMLITLATQSTQINNIETLGIDSRIINVSSNYIHHIITVFNPFLLSPYHPVEHWILNPTMYSYIFIGIVVLILFFLIFLYMRGSVAPLALFLSYLVMLTPVVGIVYIGHASTADRYAYLPSITVYIAIGYIAGRAMHLWSDSKYRKYMFHSGVLLVFIFFSYAGQLYNRVWETDETLWKYVTLKYPNQSAVAHSNLGNFYYSHRNYTKAVDEYKKALRIDKRHILTYNNLALTYHKIGDFHQEKDTYLNLVKNNEDDYQSHLLIGDYYFRSGSKHLAFEHYYKALHLNPSTLNTIVKIAMIEFDRKNIPEAKKFIDFAVELAPRRKVVLELYARIYLASGDIQKAESVAIAILKSSPENKTAIHVLDSVRKDIDTIN